MDTINYQENLIHRFISHFRNFGYELLTAENIIPESDNSLLFTNSTIVPIKKFILADKISYPGFVLLQPCFRTQNLKILFDSEQKTKYISYFKMLGIFSHPDVSISELLRQIKNYFVELECLMPNIIRCQISSMNSFLQTEWSNLFNASSMKIDLMPENFYHWVYGLKDIDGYGVTLELKQVDEKFLEFGNIIQVRKNREIIGYEFGFGVETFLARKLTLFHPIQASLISQIIPFKEDENWIKLGDCISSAVLLCRLGIKPGQGKRQYILKKIIKGILFFKNKLSLDLNLINFYCLEYELLEFGSRQSADKIISYIKKFETLQNEALIMFEDYVANQFRLFDQGLLPDISRVIDKCIKIGKERYALSLIEIENVIRIYTSRGNNRAKSHEYH